MGANWLFQIPKCDSLTEQKAILQARLEADPESKKIPDEEAEAFFASAFVLAFATPNAFAFYAKTIGFRGQATNKAFRRRATLLILGMWHQAKMQETLRILRTGTCFNDLASADQGPAKLSLEVLEAAYHRRHNLVWLCSLLRHTGRADQIPTFLDGLNDWAAITYSFYLDIGRLMFRRIVDGVGAQETQPKQSAQQLRAQLTQRSKSVALAKREITGQRTLLARQERIRQAKAAELASYLGGIRQEIAVAKASLSERLAQQADEEALLQQTHRRRIAEIETEAEAVEAEFAQSLTDLSTAWPLSGLRVALDGEFGTAERLLIESAGGRLVSPSTPEFDLRLHLSQSGLDEPDKGHFYTRDSGPAALERLLHRRVLPRISRHGSS